MTTQQLQDLFENEHTRVGLALVCYFLSLLFPGYGTLWTLLAQFLGVSVVISMGNKGIAAISKP